MVDNQNTVCFRNMHLKPKVRHTLKSYRSLGGYAQWERILREMHSTACGPFGTVLGPEANRFHRENFHFDTARYRSGRYCR